MSKPRDKFVTFAKGWKDAASGRAILPPYSAGELHDIYMRGYVAGRLAAHEMYDKAAKEFGYSPTIIRLADQ